MKKQRMTTTCIRIGEESLTKLNKIAEQKQRSTSQLMRLILEQYLNTIEI